MEKTFFALGRLGAEDFVEILLNAGNGYGVAALKLLRSMFERVVTMAHLIRNPGDLQAFMDYHSVQAWKGIKHIEQGGDDPEKYYFREDLDEIEHKYNALPASFRKKKSWAPIDLATMARRVGLGREYASLSYFPTLQLHTTLIGITTRLEATVQGTISFRTGSQRREADYALWGAHLCLSRLLEEQIEHFQLPLDRERLRIMFVDCWPGNAGEPHPAGQE